MTLIIATTVADTKRGPRVWLDGTKLLRGEFAPASRYNVSFHNGSVILQSDPDGKRKVSAYKNKPIIDLCSQKLADWFSPGEKLKAVVRKGRIVIRRIQQTIKVNRREQRILNKIATGKPLDIVSCYHGGGMMDRALHEGLKRVGIRTRISLTMEIDSRYVDASLNANPELFDEDSVIVNAPVQDIQLGKVREADIIAMGIPCTGASLAGRSRRRLTHAESHPEAGALFYQSLRLIEQFVPAVVILENVGNYQNTASMEVVRSLLSTWGYTTAEAVLSGTAFGALENRDRLVVIAVSKGLQRLSGFDIDQIVPVREKEATLSEALEPVGDDDPRWAIHKYLESKAEKDEKAGKGFKRQLYTGAEDHINTITRGYARIRSTDCHLKHPNKARYTRLLTPTEHARVKGVPEGWIAATNVAASIQHEILGQGIIWPLFDAVGYALGQSLHAAARWLAPATRQPEAEPQPQLMAA